MEPPEAEEEQQQQRQVIRWERFLPRRSLRVLLVENDDSTRHIVAALLRKCSYSVAAVADGLKAWEILQEKHYKFDLVLAEVDMPSLSGIDFLEKVAGSDLSRSIPVIMMSSQDSVNVVFKCMLKGAADFLVKPVRRNELRNLWQHVWRKHSSSSCISQVEKIDERPKSRDASGNDISMNHDNSDAESAPKGRINDREVGDCQTSGCKSENETTKLQKYKELCGVEIRKHSKLFGKELENSYGNIVLVEDSTGQHDNDITVVKNKETMDAMEIDICANEHASNENHKGTEKSDKSSHKEHSNFDEEIAGNFGSSTSFRSIPSVKSAQIIDFIGPAASKHDDSSLEKEACSNSKNTDIGKTLLLQDLSVKRSGPNGFSDQGFQERHILKHSSASAFSRYGKDTSDRKSGASPATLSMSPKESVSRFPPLATTHKEDVASFTVWKPTPSPGRENYVPRGHQITSTSNNGGENLRGHPPAEAISTSHSGSQKDEHNINHSPTEANHNKATFLPGQIEMPFPFPVGRISIENLYAGYGAILQPLLYSESPPCAPVAIHAAKEVIPSDHLGHHGNHPSYDLSSQQNCTQQHLEHEREGPTVDQEQRESEAYMCTGRDEPMNQHSNYNGEYLHSVDANRIVDITDYHGSILLSTHQGNEGGFQNVNGTCLDHGKSHREAALMKFRLKRKDRCFEKKVRYHSRKMLAEQRPRIKGQFVRQSTVKPTISTPRDDD